MKRMTEIFRKIKPPKIQKRKLPRGMTIAEHCRQIGRIKSKRKAAASRANGKLGGRPRKKTL